jgi:hypothetical protein
MKTNNKFEESEEFYKPFPITSVCRADLEQAGFDTKDVDDDTMEDLASKMADAYCDNGFWIELDVLAEDLKIKKRKNRKFNSALGI